MKECPAARARHVRKLIGTLLAAAVLCAGFAQHAGAAVDPTTKTRRCKYAIAKAVIGFGKKQMSVRSECAARQAVGAINANINCMGDPAHGSPTGSTSYDFRLLAIQQKAIAIGQRMGRRCDEPGRTPETVGLSQLCTPPVVDHSGWDDIVMCGYELMTQSSDRLSILSYRKPSEGSAPITEAEALCRRFLGDQIRMTIQGRLRKRSDCFDRQERTGAQYDCMATVAWPGRVEKVGYRRADALLLSSLKELNSVIRTYCSVNTDAMRFADNAAITDSTANAPGGATFTAVDLYNTLADAILREETQMTNALFPQELTYCGDGFVDTAGGEQCDDGNQTSCDGCDRDCTITTCLNGAACGPSELCDDGNTALEDGCNTICQPETCGDGIMQAGLGEGCDDGNVVDCDGCDSNCTSSLLCSNSIVCPNEQCDSGLGICLSGPDELRACADDTSCRGTCASGKDDGAPCNTNTDCAADGTAVCEPSTGCGGQCSGGANANRVCTSNDQCPGKCRPITGVGQECMLNTDCPPGLQCNLSNTCELPRQGVACFFDDDCGEGGFCELSNGCMLGNSDTAADTCRETCMLPSCGDGVIDANTDTNGFGGEQCDDENALDGDGCDSNCTVTGCGNGVVSPPESCDEGPGTCAGGFDDTARCLQDSECRGFCFDHPETPCTQATAATDCNGQVCFPSSGCMGGNADSTTCRSDCTIPRCGDGIIDTGEQCDDGPGVCSLGADVNEACFSATDCRGLCITGIATGSPCLSNTDCAPGICDPSSCLGGNGSTPDTCREGCVAPSCGDGVKDATEACDGADDAACPGLCSTGCACP